MQHLDATRKHPDPLAVPVASQFDLASSVPSIRQNIERYNSSWRARIDVENLSRFDQCNEIVAAFDSAPEFAECLDIGCSDDRCRPLAPLNDRTERDVMGINDNADGER
jgi:hypothetical protein